MKKITIIREELENSLNKFPEGKSKFDAIEINSILEVFKSKTRQAEKITKKYLPGQEVLTIDYSLYDSLQEYYTYLINNRDRIIQGLQEIVNKIKDLEK
ncbi:virion structural protein [Staphylococcus phage PG-2021_76]